MTSVRTSPAWSVQGKRMVTELSDLGLTPLDRLDRRLMVTSHRTELELEFEFARIVRNGDEVGAWIFIERNSGFEVHILND